MRKALWLSVGIIALALGLAGAVLPLLPTTPFVLLAVFAFARSSPRLHDWLMTHPSFGPTIINWQREGAISRRAKLMAIAAMIATLVISWALGVAPEILLLQAIVLTAVAIFILSRPTPSSQNDATPRDGSPLG